MTDSTIFSIVPVEVWADRRLTLEQVRVLGALLSFRSKNTELVWPSRQQISERTGGMHPANISTATSALEKLGWLTKDGKGGHSKATRYRITVPETVAQSATVAEEATVAQSATRPVAESATPPLAESATRKEETNEHTKEQTNRTAPATRLPADWVPSETDIRFCKTQRPDLDPFAVADQFRDYWIAAPGAKGKKQDWPATWRNWIRNQRQTAPPRGYESDKDRSRREFAEKIFGTKHEPANERDITAIAERVD